ncbi:MAG: baseplate protein J, partial [Dolichospermum sp.]
KFPQQIPSPSTVNGETRYWIRARITQGLYGQAATIRKYAIYNEVAIIDSVSDDNKTISIVGTASDFFKVGDIIRLVWLENNNEKREEYKIQSLSNNQLTLETLVTNPQAKAKGTKIFLRYVISETVPPNYDPPIIQSLIFWRKLNYEFTLT